MLPSNKNTACFSSQKNRLNELYFITLVLILLLFRPHRLLECLIKTTHSINYSIINKYNLNRTHTPLVSLTFLKRVTFIILTFYSLVLKQYAKDSQYHFCNRSLIVISLKGNTIVNIFLIT